MKEEKMLLIMKHTVCFNLAWQWRYLTDKTGFLFIGTHCTIPSHITFSNPCSLLNQSHPHPTPHLTPFHPNFPHPSSRPLLRSSSPHYGVVKVVISPHPFSSYLLSSLLTPQSISPIPHPTPTSPLFIPTSRILPHALHSNLHNHHYSVWWVRYSRGASPLNLSFTPSGTWHLSRPFCDNPSPLAAVIQAKDAQKKN